LCQTRLRLSCTVNECKPLVVGGAGAGAGEGANVDREGDGDRATPKAKKKKVSTLGALLRLSLPDLPLLCAAFVFLVLYAVAAASVPHFTAGAYTRSLQSST